MTEANAQHRRVGATLIGIVFVALLLRLWGISHGLPNVYNPDEHFEVYRALRLGLGQFDFDRMTKGGYFYLLFVEFGGYFAWLTILGKIGSAQDFAGSIVADPSPVWLIGRVTTAVIGTLNVFVVYLLGRRIGGIAVGLVAAAILGVSRLHVANSHHITVDVPMVCLVTLALYYAVKIADEGRLRDYVLAGVVTGLAVMTKLPAAVVALPILLAHISRFRGWNRRSDAIKPLVWFGICAGVVYVAGNPGIVWKFGEVLGGTLGMFAGEGWSTHDIPLETREKPDAWSFYWRALLAGVGAPVLLAGAAGMAIALRVRDRSLLILASFVVVFFGILVLARDPNLIYPRYLLPVVPPLAVLAAYGLVRGLERLPVRGGWRVGIATTTVLVLVSPTLLASIEFDRIHARKDTRTHAREWIEANVADGATIFMRGNPEVKSALPVPLESTAENLTRMAAELQQDNPGKARFLRMRAELDAQPAYDVVTTRQTETWPTWVSIKRSGVDLVILRHRFSGEWSEIPAGRVPQSRARFDLELTADPDFTVVAVFDPETLGAPGPMVRIFGRRDSVMTPDE